MYVCMCVCVCLRKEEAMGSPGAGITEVIAVSLALLFTVLNFLSCRSYPTFVSVLIKNSQRALSFSLINETPSLKSREGCGEMAR